jgi:hypothetical protein
MDPNDPPQGQEQPRQLMVMSLEQFLLSAIMGQPLPAQVAQVGPIRPRSPDFPPPEHLFYQDPLEEDWDEDEEDEEDQEDQEGQEEDQLVGQRRRRAEDTDDDEPPAKMPKLEKEINYNFIELNTMHKIDFTKRARNRVLSNEWIEPNRFVRLILGDLPLSMKDRLLYMARFMKNDEEYSEWTPPTEEEEESYDYEGKKELLYNIRDKMLAGYIKECRLKTAFRKVLVMWRIYKLNQKPMTDVDPITLSAPEKEVAVYDWHVQKKFVFDAKSLATFIESKLLYNEGGFALPMYPCNPWTNLEFSYAQLVSIHNQLQEHGELRWGLATMRKYNFNKNVWHKYHNSALTMSAIKNSLIRLDSYDARELILDFIFAKMDEILRHSNHYIDQAYRYAVIKAPTHWYIEEWKSIAMLHYESTHFGHNKTQQVTLMCKKLFKKQPQFLKELVEMKIIKPA